MKRLGFGLLVGLGLTLSACSPDPNLQELVKEMRAERMQRRSAGAVGDPAQLAGDLVQQAMAPLRDVLIQLDRRQGDLAERQAVLTAELREWSRLTVDASNQRQGVQAKGLQERLAELETQLAAQRARQGEMEVVIGAALNKAAGQLEQFLERLKVAEQDVPAATPTAGDGQGAAPSGGQGASPDGDGERDSRQAGLWPLWVVAFAAIGAGVWLLLPRRVESSTVGGEPWGSIGPAEDDAPLDPAELEISDAIEAPDDVREIWDTAAMLGEAVGKLRHEQGASSASEPERGERLPEASAAPAPQPEAALPLPSESVERAAPQPSVATAAPAPAELGFVSHPEAERPTAPGAMVCHVHADDPARLEGDLRDLLRRDSRVLVTPPPDVQRVGGGLQVAFATLPDLAPGQLALLEQRIREVGR